MPTPTAPWWRSAVIYQIYPRSFADSNGDGVGDLGGIITKMPYLASLGVDALWLSPVFASPQVDHGYDISDYRAIDPLFGSLDDLDALVAAAHAHGIRVTLDFVPNHTSDQHAWFRAAVAAGRGSAGAFPVPVHRGAWVIWRAAPEQLALRVRRTIVDAGRRAGRLPRAVVLPPVRPGAAGSQLAKPRGAGGVLRGPALLDGPGRGRVPHRRLRRPHQGRLLGGHAHRRPDHPQGRGQPGPRDLPAAASRARRLPGRPHGRHRDRRRGPHRVAVPAAGPDAPGLQLPVRARRVRRSRDPAGHRLVAGRERPGRGPDDVGDGQPRHTPLGDPAGARRPADRGLCARHHD